MNTKPTLAKSHTDSVLNSLLVAAFLGIVAVSAMPAVTAVIA